MNNGCTKKRAAEVQPPFSKGALPDLRFLKLQTTHRRIKGNHVGIITEIPDHSREHQGDLGFFNAAPAEPVPREIMPRKRQPGKQCRFIPAHNCESWQKQDIKTAGAYFHVEAVPAWRRYRNITGGSPAFQPAGQKSAGTLVTDGRHLPYWEDIVGYEDEKMIQEKYLEGLKRYKAQGVRITIDGSELPEEQWDKIFRVSERATDGAAGFYMADYIEEPEGEISEIRLDRVYVKKLDR